MQDHRQIIVIDDDADDQFMLRRAFEATEMRHPVTFIPNGKQAIDYFFQDSGDCRLASLIILDLFLPDIHGLELLRRLRTNKATRHIPIIVLTQSNEDQHIIESYQYGANSYIQKGPNYKQFQDKVTCITRYWLDIAQLPIPQWSLA